MDTSTIASVVLVNGSYNTLLSKSNRNILREGGTIMEAMVVAPATFAVVHPDMNRFRRDSFWLIVPSYGEPIAIEACGADASLANLESYTGLKQSPFKDLSMLEQELLKGGRRN